MTCLSAEDMKLSKEKQMTELSGKVYHKPAKWQNSKKEEKVYGALYAMSLREHAQSGKLN